MASPKWVSLEFPRQFLIGMRGMADLCGWRVRESGDEFAICLDERYREGAAPPLVSAISLATAADAGRAEGYAQIERWAASDPVQLDTDAVLEGLDLPADFNRPESTESAWANYRLGVMITPPHAVAANTRAIFAWVAAQTPTASLWLFRFDPKVAWRFAAARALFAAEQSPEILDRPPDAFRGFGPGGASRSLMYGFSAFTDPMLMTASPWLLGMSAPRRTGSLVINFGEYRPGFSGQQAPELTDLLRPRGLTQPHRSVRRPHIDAEGASMLVHRWATKMNGLFIRATDPAGFRSIEGKYLPSDHVGHLLSLEHLFGSLQGLLAHARGDGLVRLELAFSLLDQLQGIGFDTWAEMLSLTPVTRGLAQLEASLPTAVREPLLVRCRAAVEALREVTGGFALSERITGNEIRLRSRTGDWTNIPLEEATWRYLRLLRNVSHSYTELVRDPRDLSLLASHGGDVPDALCDLALLHVLRFLESH